MDRMKLGIVALVLAALGFGVLVGTRWLPRTDGELPQLLVRSELVAAVGRTPVPVEAGEVRGECLSFRNEYGDWLLCPRWSIIPRGAAKQPEPTPAQPTPEPLGPPFAPETTP